MPQMDETRLLTIIEAKLNNSLGWLGGKLSKDRIRAMEYYNGEPFGNEQEGRSKVISRDVAEAIDSVMPGLIKVFATTDTMISCQSRTPDEEASAKQATDYLNWVFQSQPNAFELLQTWIKDGLLSKLGVVKSWWEDSEEVTKESYESLTRFQFLSLIKDDDVELVHYTAKAPEPAIPSPLDIAQQVGQALAMAQPPQGAPQGPAPQQQPQAPPQGQPPQAQQGQQPPQGAPPAAPTPAQVKSDPTAMLQQLDDAASYDCQIKRKKKSGHVCIAAIPPEEFLTDRRAVSLETATFCAHRSKRTVTEVIEMGFPAAKVRLLAGGDELDFNPEVIERFRQEDEMPIRGAEDLDDSMRPVWIADCWLKVDFDGDGVAEWRHVILGGSGTYEILENEDCDGHPFSAWTPNKMPHKLYGESLADKTLDIQFIKSTVWRQALDGMYFNNAPQLVVVEGQANMEDVLTRRPGGVIRARSLGAVQPLPVQDQSASSMAMINYLDSVRESRTGVRRFSSALDADALNPFNGTATGTRMVEDSSQDRVMLLARNFAEQGLKPLFNRLLELVCKYQDKPMTVRLRGTWTDIDPSTWETKMDMTVMVGLGTGNRDSQVGQLTSMLTQVDQPIVQLQGGLSGPLLTAENVYNKLAKLCEAMGFRNVDAFYTDPAKSPPTPQQPKPDPAAQAAQQAMQLEQTKAQSQMQLAAQKADHDKQLSEQDAQLKAELARQKAQQDYALAQQAQDHRLQLEQTRAQADIEIERHKAGIAAAGRVAEAGAHALISHVAASAAPSMPAM